MNNRFTDVFPLQAIWPKTGLSLPPPSPLSLPPLSLIPPFLAPNSLLPLSPPSVFSLSLLPPPSHLLLAPTSLSLLPPSFSSLPSSSLSLLPPSLLPPSLLSLSSLSLLPPPSLSILLAHRVGADLIVMLNWPGKKKQESFWQPVKSDRSSCDADVCSDIQAVRAEGDWGVSGC